MNKILFSFFFFLSISATINAQDNYLLHNLKSGETLTILAKKYNTSVGDIMRLNGMHADSKLIYGSVIKIPKIPIAIPQYNNEDKNLSRPVVQEATIEDSMDNKPFIGSHIVLKGETLYSIARQYKVSVNDIKAWNKLIDNAISIGDKIFIGTAKVETKANALVIAEKNLNGIKKEEIVDPEASESYTNKIKIRKELVEPQPEVMPELNYSGKGFFERKFTGETGMNVSGTAKYFKSVSGWDDGKFYVLMNEVEVGTIVKITAANGNIIYAKVLMPMIEDIKENKGLSFRISNAAAKMLGITESKFNLFISW